MKKNFIFPKFAMACIAFFLTISLLNCSNSKKPNSDSNSNGVQIGIITYSWRSMPGTPEDIIKYCQETGISSLELMGNVVEEYAGIPAFPQRLKPRNEMTEEDNMKYNEAVEKAKEKQKEWRLSISMEKFKELKQVFDEAGINIHIVKFSPAGWSDEEIDYAFNVAKILGAKGVSNEIGHDACKRLGKFAEKHDMYAVFHNHMQPGDSNFNFDEFLAYSPNNMLNLDVGHYFGSTGKHPNELIERLHDRIYSIHLKDKTGKDSNPANTNQVWGEGETPLNDILKLIQKNNWPIYCDIELEYKIPEESDAVKESKKCVEYCKKILQ